MWTQVERSKYVTTKKMQELVLDIINMIIYVFIICCYIIYIFLKLCDFFTIKKNKNIILEEYKI